MKKDNKSVRGKNYEEDSTSSLKVLCGQVTDDLREVKDIWDRYKLTGGYNIPDTFILFRIGKVLDLRKRVLESLLEDTRITIESSAHIKKEFAKLTSAENPLIPKENI